MVRGGRLDGWRYTFQRFVCHYVDGVREALLMEVIATPPNWPFPCRLRMRAGRDYRRLLRIRSDITKVLDADLLRDRCIADDIELRAMERAARPRT